MERYTIYCTPEQIRRASLYGAPIQKCENTLSVPSDITDGYNKPVTAEQMIGWLESTNIIVCIVIQKKFNWCYSIQISGFGKNPMFLYEQGDNRKEVTLSAIDTALECLENAAEVFNKK